MARLGLVAAGVLLAVALTELVLQAGALALRLTGDDLLPSRREGTQRVLCLGDSNTYGLHLEDRDRDAYPALLESLWNEGQTESPMQVFNAGVPGTNSSQVLRNLAGMIEAFDPHLVVVMVGVNDFWSEPVPTGKDADDGGLGALLRRHSRAFRLLLLLRRRLEPQVLEVGSHPGEGEEDGAGFVRFGDREFTLGRTPGTRVAEPMGAPRSGERRAFEAGVRRALQENLGGLVALARDRDVELVLMTYPSQQRAYAVANAAVREAAARVDARLVDLEARFRALCPDVACTEWLYPDQHPRASGYRVVAETLVASLAQPPR